MSRFSFLGYVVELRILEFPLDYDICTDKIVIDILNCTDIYIIHG